MFFSEATYGLGNLLFLKGQTDNTGLLPFDACGNKPILLLPEKQPQTNELLVALLQ